MDAPNAHADARHSGSRRTSCGRNARRTEGPFTPATWPPSRAAGGLGLRTHKPFNQHCETKLAMVVCWSTKGDPMSVQKQSVSFTDTAYTFAKELVEAGEYPNVSAAVSGELAKAKAERGRERSLFEAELERRLSLPPHHWEPVGEASNVTEGARAHLAAMAQKT